MNIVLLVAAVLCAMISAFLGFGWLDGGNLLGWMSLSLAFGWGALLVGATPFNWPNRQSG